jgi:fructose-1,6-bisphosphatase/inositol monophosphatase family enzyme
MTFAGLRAAAARAQGLAEGTGDTVHEGGSCAWDCAAMIAAAALRTETDCFYRAD